MNALTPEEVRARLLDAAMDLGFTAVGVAPVESAAEDRDRLFTWLARGHHASMDWMARTADTRTDITRLLPGARSVISLAMNYYVPVPTSANDCCGALKVSRYAWGEDYHRVLGRKLAVLRDRLGEWLPGEQFVVQVDTGPVMEKAWAQRAGIGWIGKNGCLVTRSVGSWVFLGEIVTTAALPYDRPHADFCGTCTRCLESCPTDAIPAPYVIDANRCVSYWTIEHRGEFPPTLADDFDGWIFGCDVCQDVCPWNRFERSTAEEAFQPHAACLCPPRDRWSALSEDEFAREFADSALKRAQAAGLARNIRSQSVDPLRRVLQIVDWDPPGSADDMTDRNPGNPGPKRAV